MSELTDNMAAVVEDRALGVEDIITHLPSGVKFSATIETNLDPFTMPSELANDPRDKVRLYVSQGQPQPMEKEDLISFDFQGATCTFRVVSGYYSPVGLQNTFLCIHVVDGKDQA